MVFCVSRATSCWDSLVIRLRFCKPLRTTYVIHPRTEATALLTYGGSLRGIADYARRPPLTKRGPKALRAARGTSPARPALQVYRSRVIA